MVLHNTRFHTNGGANGKTEYNDNETECNIK